MKIELLKKFSLQKRLVNSISLLEDCLYYTSARDNCVYQFNMSTERETVVIDKGCGYGKYKFREPVHAFAYKQSTDINIIVSDWHNHRLVKYKNGQYVTELGVFEPTKSKIKNVLKFIKGFSQSGQYIDSHFNGSDTRHHVRTYFLSNFWYFISSSCRLLSKRFYAINKPNGSCLYKGGILFTQKNNRCLTYTDLNLSPINNYILPENGRLGNINTDFYKTVFCSESTGKVYQIDESGEILAINLQQLEIKFKPFSARFMENELLAVISMSNLHIFEVATGIEVSRYKVDGELHGLEVDGDDIYVSDRLYAKVYKMRLSDD